MRIMDALGSSESGAQASRFSTADSKATAVQVALSGAGVAQVPDGLACRQVLDGRLQPLLTDYAAAAPPLVLVYPGNRYLTAKVRAFKEFFANEFPKEGWWPQIARHGLTAVSSAPCLESNNTNEVAARASITGTKNRYLVGDPVKLSF